MEVKYLAYIPQPEAGSEFDPKRSDPKTHPLNHHNHVVWTQAGEIQSAL